MKVTFGEAKEGTAILNTKPKGMEIWFEMPIFGTRKLGAMMEVGKTWRDRVEHTIQNVALAMGADVGDTSVTYPKAEDLTVSLTGRRVVVRGRVELSYRKGFPAVGRLSTAVDGAKKALKKSGWRD